MAEAPNKEVDPEDAEEVTAQGGLTSLSAINEVNIKPKRLESWPPSAQPPCSVVVCQSWVSV